MYCWKYFSIVLFTWSVYSTLRQTAFYNTVECSGRRLLKKGRIPLSFRTPRWNRLGCFVASNLNKYFGVIGIEPTLLVLGMQAKIRLRHIYKFYMSTPFLYLPRSFVVSESNISLLAESDGGSFCLPRCCFMLFSVKREHVILAFIRDRRELFYLCLQSDLEEYLSLSMRWLPLMEMRYLKTKKKVAIIN